MARAGRKKAIDPIPAPLFSRGASQVQAKCEIPLEQIAAARHMRPSKLFLRFADGLEGTWTFEQLGLDMSNMKLTTIRVSDSGNSVEIKSKWGEDVQLDSSSLRVRVDAEYAQEIENRLNILAREIGL